MALSKIHVQIGDFSFSGEGEEEWLASQLDRIFDRTEEVISFIQHSTKKQSLPEKNDDETRSFLGDIEKKLWLPFLRKRPQNLKLINFLQRPYGCMQRVTSSSQQAM